MISSTIARSSAASLLLAGLTLLFAPDVLLPRLIPGYPVEGLWLGQFLGAAWLGLAALNWLNRTALLGGIYGRPVVSANALAYFVGAAVLLRAATREPRPGAFWLIVLVVGLFAAVYCWLLFRGPVQGDLDAYRAGRGENFPKGARS